jgi:hypothetical protein
VNTERKSQVLLADANGSVIGIDLLTTTEAVGEWSSQHEAEGRRQEIATTDSCRTSANACIAHVWLSIHLFANASEDGLTLPKGQGIKVTTSEVEEPLLVLLFRLSIFVVGFGTGEAHVAFVDAIFTEILLARDTFNQFIGFDFRPT